MTYDCFENDWDDVEEAYGEVTGLDFLYQAI